MGKEESAETAPARPATPPPKPAAAKTAAAPASSKTAAPRRSLLSWVTLAWVAFTASMLASLTATARFMFPNVLFEPPPTFKAGRSEEHTSELQSPCNLVCRLLLEKKKKVVTYNVSRIER